MALLFLKYGRHIDVRANKTLLLLEKYSEGRGVLAIEPIKKYSKINLINIYNYFLSILTIWRILKREDIKTIWAVDIYGGIAAFIIKYFVSVNYIYEVYDESFQNTKKKIWPKILFQIEKKISESASKTIRVEEYRKIKIDDIVIKNLPSKIISQYKLVKKNHRKIIVFSGQLISTRGIDLAIEFAIKNNDVYVAIFGNMHSIEMMEKISCIPNIYYFGRHDQKKVYKFCAKARAQFALYDPTVPININAASNKFYESEYLGIYTIINKEIKFSQLNNDPNLIKINYKITDEDCTKIRNCISVKFNENFNPQKKIYFFEDEFEYKTSKWISNIY